MHSIVLTTCPDAETAGSITERLLDARLVACANSFPVSSVYRWKGKVERTDEILVLYKARTDDFDEIAAEIRKLHPYETPCVELLKVDGCNRPCLDWITESTERPQAGSGRR